MRTLIIKYGVFSVMMAAILLAGSSALAKNKAKGLEGKPAGWEKGENAGGKSNVPPGLEKKSDLLPPGLSKVKQDELKGNNPPGWEKGEKKGWEGSVPPGIKKKGDPGLSKEKQVEHDDETKKEDKKEAKGKKHDQ
ncbi:MAG: hypothetical protein HZA78_12385 [Candidatus Schekmanbacteria bacterium]|nr:hypothetical protein [Candidatus Schekmanbacteria bacterium]